MSNLPNGEVVNGEPGPTNLVKKLYGIPNDRGGTSWLEECPDYLATASQSPDHALLIRYKESRSGPANKTLNLATIEVQSPYLKNILRQVFKNYPGHTLDEEEVSFDAPFHPLFHQWPSLISTYEKSKASKNGHPDEFEALINVLEEEFADATKDARSLIKNGNMSFALLWTLYPPGEPVVGKIKGEQHCFFINSCKYLMGEVVPTLAIEMISLDHDGDKYGWGKTQVFVEAFGGSCKIDSLPAVPLHFVEDSEILLKTLHARGAAAIDLIRRSPAYKSYTGPIRLHRNFDMEEVQVFIEGRIMVDPKFHAQHADRYCPNVSTIPHKVEWMLTRDAQTKIVTTTPEKELQANGLLSIVDNLNSHMVLSRGSSKLQLREFIDENDSLVHHHGWTQLLYGISPESFCRSVVRGYDLTSKAWAEFELKNIVDIKWNKNAFDALVIPPARKRLLEALVKQQQMNKADAAFDDVVQGKGQGLIMLLAGPPGTGKTLTAESIADRLHLPLYAVSASELGDTSKEIENYFGQILRLAASWDAVLLIDEADAFLEKRVDTPEARDRNKRVAGGFFSTQSNGGR